jgi:P27 family predicted phage terminase small subunit
MKNSANPKPPKALSPAAKRWWRDIQSEFSIDDPGGLLILTTAAEAYDRMKGAQELIEREGLIARDRFGQPKAHPGVVIERDARGQMAALLRDLHLDLEPLKARPGRPSGSK